MALSDIVGQTQLKNLLRVPLLSYQRGRSIGNILLTGPAGNGKTFSAENTADEVSVPFFRFDCSSQGKKDLTRILSLAIRECPDSRFVLNPDEIQAIGYNASLSGAFLDLLDINKRQYPIAKNGNPHSFSNTIIIGSTNEPWKMPRAIDSRFSLLRVRLNTPTDDDIAQMMLPQFDVELDTKMVHSFAVATGNNARKANDIVDHINQLIDLKEEFTVESVLTDLALEWDGAESAHIQILEFLVNHQKGDFMGYANQDETARFCRMHRSELKYYVEFLERRGYVVINERSQLEITDHGRQRLN